MLENRSLENLLRHLYDGDLPPGASFAGLSKNAPLVESNRIVLSSEMLGLVAEASTEQVSSIQTVGEAMTYLESIRDHLNN